MSDSGQPQRFSLPSPFEASRRSASAKRRRSPARPK